MPEIRAGGSALAAQLHPKGAGLLACYAFYYRCYIEAILSFFILLLFESEITTLSQTAVQP